MLTAVGLNNAKNRGKEAADQLDIYVLKSRNDSANAINDIGSVLLTSFVSRKCAKH